jgi:hypothetical protein
MADAQIIANEEGLNAAVLVLGPGIVLDAKGYTYKVFNPTDGRIVVGLVQIVKADLSIGRGGNKTLRVSHKVDAGDPA